MRGVYDSFIEDRADIKEMSTWDFNKVQGIFEAASKFGSDLRNFISGWADDEQAFVKNVLNSLYVGLQKQYGGYTEGDGAFKENEKTGTALTWEITSNQDISRYFSMFLVKTLSGKSKKMGLKYGKDNYTGAYFEGTSGQIYVGMRSAGKTETGMLKIKVIVCNLKAEKKDLPSATVQDAMDKAHNTEKPSTKVVTVNTSKDTAKQEKAAAQAKRKVVAASASPSGLIKSMKCGAKMTSFISKMDKKIGKQVTEYVTQILSLMNTEYNGFTADGTSTIKKSGNQIYFKTLVTVDMGSDKVYSSNYYPNKDDIEHEKIDGFGLSGKYFFADKEKESSYQFNKKNRNYSNMSDDVKGQVFVGLDTIKWLKNEEGKSTKRVEALVILMDDPDYDESQLIVNPYQTGPYNLANSHCTVAYDVRDKDISGDDLDDGYNLPRFYTKGKNEKKLQQAWDLLLQKFDASTTMSDAERILGKFVMTHSCCAMD